MKIVLSCLIFTALVPLNTSAQIMEYSPLQKQCETAISRFAWAFADIESLFPMCPLIQSKAALDCLELSVGKDTPGPDLIMACRNFSNEKQIQKLSELRRVMRARWVDANDTMKAKSVYKIMEENK